MYLLRWRFDYAGKPTKVGGWHDVREGQAALTNKEGLVRAAIEGVNVITEEERVLAECDGHDFVNFGWLALFRMNETRTVQDIVGLRMVTREMHLDVLTTGMLAVSKRPEEDKSFHYAGFGR